VAEDQPLEIVTGNNDADAVWFLRWVERNFDAQPAPPMSRSIWRPGAAIPAGLGVANIDPQGKVHPDTYWSDYTVGSVKETPFSQLWTGPTRCWPPCATRPAPAERPLRRLRLQGRSAAATPASAPCK
jgi:MoaA/NifB/PqqE/SkfB family radical SAM enzyme